MQRILVTGAAGKVGQAFIARLLGSGDSRFAGFTVRALCHNRVLPASPRMEVITGPVERRETAARAAEGVTHVLHLATSTGVPRMTRGWPGTRLKAAGHQRCKAGKIAVTTVGQQTADQLKESSPCGSARATRSRPA